MKDITGPAIIFLAIVILILGIPITLNQYSQFSDRQTAQAIILTTTIPELTPDENIFGKNWCRNEGFFKHCYRFFSDNTYEYGFDGRINDGHAQIQMPGQWNQSSRNQYEIPDPKQTFSYLDGQLLTNLNPSYGPLIPDSSGLVRSH